MVHYWPSQRQDCKVNFLPMSSKPLLLYHSETQMLILLRNASIHEGFLFLWATLVQAWLDHRDHFIPPSAAGNHKVSGLYQSGLALHFPITLMLVMLESTIPFLCWESLAWWHIAKAYLQTPALDRKCKEHDLTQKMLWQQWWGCNPSILLIELLLPFPIERTSFGNLVHDAWTTNFLKLPRMCRVL